MNTGPTSVAVAVGADWASFGFTSTVCSVAEPGTNCISGAATLEDSTDLVTFVAAVVVVGASDAVALVPMEGCPSTIGSDLSVRAAVIAVRGER